MGIQILSVNNVAENMLIWKVTGVGASLLPLNDAELFSKSIESLLDKEYIINVGGDSKIAYHVTLKGFEFVYETGYCKALNTLILT